MTCHHHFWRVVPLFSTSNHRSPSRTRLPIATFLSPVISSFGTIKVGSADFQQDFQQDNSQGNPVLAYLQRHRTAQGLTTPLVTGYYSWLRLSALKNLSDIVKSCFEKAQEQQKAEGYIKLERGFATIPLPGIDSALGTSGLGLYLSVLVH